MLPISVPTDDKLGLSKNQEKNNKKICTIDIRNFGDREHKSSNNQWRSESLEINKEGKTPSENKTTNNEIECPESDTSNNIETYQDENQKSLRINTLS